MKSLLILRPWAVVALAIACWSLTAGPKACAQNAASSSSSSSSKTDKPPETPVRPNADSYAVSLGTGEVINLNGDQQGAGNANSGETPVSLAEYADGLRVKRAGNDFRNQFFYGSSVFGYYSNGFSGTAYTSVISSAFAPYLGMLVPTKTGSYMIQYAAVIDPNTESSSGVQAYHSMLFNSEGALTRRWYWGFSAGGSYGSELARAQGSLGYSAVQGTPVVNTSSAATLFPANNVSFGNIRTSLTWLKSQRERIGLTTYYTYSGIAGLHTTSGDIGSHDNLMGGVLAYTRTLTPRVDVRAYGDAATVLNGPVCNTVGGGLGATVRFTRSTVLDAQGGPQRNSVSCGGQQSYNFSGSLVHSLRNGDRIYASGNRVFTTAYRTNGYWEDNATVGFAKGVRRLTLIGEAGYLRGQPLANSTSSIQGYFVAPRLRYKILESMGFSAGYRLFNETGGGLVGGNLRFAMVGIDWYPAPKHFK